MSYISIFLFILISFLYFSFFYNYVFSLFDFIF